MPQITLEKMNEKNWAVVTKLSVSKEQKLVFPIENVYWLGISKYEEHTQLYAIAYDSEYIGMVGVGVTETQAGLISPLMIDEKYQKKGIGTAALHETINVLQKEYQVEKIQINIRKNNEKGRLFFEKSGFYMIDSDHKDYILEYKMKG